MKTVKYIFFTLFVSSQIIFSTEIESKKINFIINESLLKIQNNSETHLLKLVENDFYISESIKSEKFDSPPFVAIGTHWNLVEPSSEVRVSLQYILDGKTSEWLEINIDEDMINDGYKVPGSLIFLPSDYSSFRIKVEGYDKHLVSHLSLSLINPGMTSELGNHTIEKKKPSNFNVTDDFELPPVVSRTEWNCPDGQGSRWPTSYTNVTHLIVHHSATENSSSDWAAVVRTFWHWHTIDNGWGDIGYNFLVDPNGVVYEGRAGGNNARGAHFCGHNSNTMGVCVIGNFTDVRPKDAAIASLVKVLTWKCNLDSIDPLGRSFHSSSGKTLNKISGHRDGCSTACPGTILYNTLSSVRADIYSLLNNKSPEISNISSGATTSNFPAYRPFKVSFTQLMDQATVQNAISISPQTDFEFNWLSAKTISIEPLNSWQFTSTYTLSIEESAISLYGDFIDGDNDGIPGGEFQHTFNITDPDNEPPFVTGGFPIGSDININAEMKFFFNEEVDGIIGRIALLDSNNSNVSLADGKIINENFRTYISFRTFSQLKPNNQYKLLLNSGISDFYGNEMPSDTFFVFNTDDGVYPVGNLLRDFNDDSQILDPTININSQFINTINTSFAWSGTKAIEGEISGRLIYEFLEESDASVFLQFSDEVMLSESDSIISIWIFGDYSGNEISIHFDDVNTNVYDIGDINWFGWEVFEISLTQFINTPNSIYGIQVSKSANGEKNGTLYFDELLSVDKTITGIENVAIHPERFNLYQNYPNPFNPTTSIEYSIPRLVEGQDAHLVTLKIYDALGREIATLVNDFQKPGSYSINWQANKYASGVYFYKLTYNKYSSTKKMILLN
jgi:hypothetical protein